MQRGLPLWHEKKWRVDNSQHAVLSVLGVKRYAYATYRYDTRYTAYDTIHIDTCIKLKMGLSQCIWLIMWMYMLNGIFKFKQSQICNVSAVSHLVNLLYIMITEKFESRYSVMNTNIVILCNQIKYNKIFYVSLSFIQ